MTLLQYAVVKQQMGDGSLCCGEGSDKVLKLSEVFLQVYLIHQM